MCLISNYPFPLCLLRFHSPHLSSLRTMADKLALKRVLSQKSIATKSKVDQLRWDDTCSVCATRWRNVHGNQNNGVRSTEHVPFPHTIFLSPSPCFLFSSRGGGGLTANHAPCFCVCAGTSFANSRNSCRTRLRPPSPTLSPTTRSFRPLSKRREKSRIAIHG